MRKTIDNDGRIWYYIYNDREISSDTSERAVRMSTISRKGASPMATEIHQSREFHSGSQYR